ncbi:hypothetical protein DM02DRAFT_730992 [Periconia macrospinosa]|uniref:Uncharacterized protein n=1 Tax=Periconia macrospinosa TaxID=97972 RepID=A0A2V1DF49_9PLEO|nr:hypothetical protein DM02DRAFT_730992 [Periconia macrospinosa]
MTHIMDRRASHSWNDRSYLRQTGQSMIRPKPEKDPDRFRQPRGHFVDQVDLPPGVGVRPGDKICPHCLEPYDIGHTSWKTCRSRCGCCKTYDHQGKYCGQRWVSWSFYTGTLLREPCHDENVQIRPTEDEVKRLVAAGHTWAREILPSETTKMLKIRAQDERILYNSEHTVKRQVNDAAVVPARTAHLEAMNQLLREKSDATASELKDVKAKFNQEKQNLVAEIGRLHERLQRAEENAGHAAAEKVTTHNGQHLSKETRTLIYYYRSKAESAEEKAKEAEKRANEANTLLEKVRKRIKEMGLFDRVWNHLVKD